MVSEVNSQLLKLLERHRNDVVVSSCLESLAETDEVRVSADGVLPLEQAIDIYSTRAKINADLNDGIIKGYDILLSCSKKCECFWRKANLFGTAQQVACYFYRRRNFAFIWCS